MMKNLFLACLLISESSAFAGKRLPLSKPKLTLAQAEDTATSSDRSLVVCQKIIDHIFPVARELILFSPLSQHSALGARVLGFKGSQCTDENYDYVMDMGLQILESHTGKIGVLLTTPDVGSKSYAITEGIKFAASSSKKLDKFVFQSIGEARGAILKGLSELIFVHRVGIIIGGSNPTENQTVHKYIKSLMIVFLGIGDFNPEPNPWYFRVNPSSKQLSEKIVSNLFSERISKFSVIGPVSVAGSIVDLVSIAQKKGLQIMKQITYAPDNFASIDDAIRKLFNIDPSVRAEELKLLIEQKKAEADTSGLAFKPSEVTFPPIKDFEALVILDDFRTVRHVLKLIKYHGVTGLKFFGNHQWRSPNLITPRDKLLGKSIFVDFVGKYNQLPFPVETLKDNPYFVPPYSVPHIDYKLIGYRAAGIAMASLDFPDQRHRTWSNDFLTKSISQAGFPDGLAFDSERQALWPVYSLVTGPEGISLTPTSSAKVKSQ